MFLLKIFLNRLSPIKVSIQEVKEVFTYVNVKFTKWRVKPDYSSISFFPCLFLFFPCLFEWLLLVSPTLTSAWVPLQLLLPLEPEFTSSSLPWNPLFLRASSYILLLPSIFLTWGESIYPLIHGIRNLL